MRTEPTRGRQGRSPKAPPRWPLAEGGHLGGSGATGNLLDAIIAADVGLPFIADRVRVGGDSAFDSGLDHCDVLNWRFGVYTSPR